MPCDAPQRMEVLRPDESWLASCPPTHSATHADPFSLCPAMSRYDAAVATMGIRKNPF